MWAIDAKERMQLGDGSWASWLCITDEASGAVVYAEAFPIRYWSGIDAVTVREHLQSAFELRGRPKKLRFDNGQPWGTTSAVPSSMGLWLIGAGFELSYGRPARSTDNAIVERSHGILDAWIEPEQCQDFTHLEQQLAYFVHFRNHRYPLPCGQTRAERYPELFCNEQSYEARLDQEQWQIQAVYDYLATFRFQRKVSINGRISLFSREYSVGRQLKRRTVAIQMDAQEREWVVYDDYGEVLKRFTPQDLSYDTLFNMKLAHRRKNGKA